MAGNMTIQTGTTYTTTPTDQTSQTGGVISPPTQTGSGIGGSSTVVPTETPQTRANVVTTTTTGPVTQNSGMAENRLTSTDKKLETALADLDKLIKMIKGATDIAAILIELASMQRQAALDQRLASRELAKAQLEGQAAETRQAAVKELVAAIVSMVVSFVAAGITIAGAGKALAEIKGSAKSWKQMDELTGDLKGMTKGTQEFDDTTSAISRLGHNADTGLRKAENITMRFNAISQMVNALGEGMAAMIRASAKMDEAQGQSLAAKAQDTQADGDTFKALMDSIDEMIRTAIEFVKKMQDAEVELMAAASRG